MWSEEIALIPSITDSGTGVFQTVGTPKEHKIDQSSFSL